MDSPFLKRHETFLLFYPAYDDPPKFLSSKAISYDLRPKVYETFSPFSALQRSTAATTNVTIRSWVQTRLKPLSIIYGAFFSIKELECCIQLSNLIPNIAYQIC